MIPAIEKVLSKNKYPGRGIALGQSADGLYDIAVYFIMGRSANSRNRIFVETTGGIRTEAHDPSELKDPSLVIYTAVRECKGDLIVTNGEQTDTIYEYLTSGKTFEEALATWLYEPDPPIFTPRISGIVRGTGKPAYTLSILKKDVSCDACARYIYNYDGLAPGEGRFIHTYAGDGDPVPSFMGEPVSVQLNGSIDELSQTVWRGLNTDNRVSLYVCFIDRKTGLIQKRITNKNR